MCYWSGRPAKDLMFSVAYAASAPWNDSHWDNERFNKLLVEARAEHDEKKRAQMYAEMQKIVRDEGDVVVSMFNQIVEAHSKKIAMGPLSAHIKRTHIATPSGGGLPDKQHTR